MDLDFLKNLLGSLGQSSQPQAQNQQYPMSPMDPMKDQPSILSPMLSPPGIQAPLYNYTESPESNMVQGNALATPVPTTMESMAALKAPSYDTAPAIDMPSILDQKPMAKPNMAPPMPQPVTSPAPVPPLAQPPVPQAPTADDMMKQLQADRKDQLRNLQLAESADRIGTAIAGQGHLAYEPGKFDGLKKIAEMDLSDFLDRDKRNKENTKFDLDIAKARAEAGDADAQRNPNSELSKVARASVIDSLTRIGRKDLASKVTNTMSSKQVEDLFGQNNLANMVSQFEANENRKEMAKDRNASKAEQAKSKQENVDIGRLDKANKMITASIASGRTAFGKSGNILRSSEAIETLVNQQPRGQMTNPQIVELAKSLDAMLSQGAATISGTDKLIPKSISGDISKLTSYISNIPKGAGQAKFVNKMMETVEREKALADTQIKREAQKMLSSYADLAKKQPEAWKLMLMQQGLPENIFESNPTSNIEKNVDKDAVAAELKRRGL